MVTASDFFPYQGGMIAAKPPAGPPAAMTSRSSCSLHDAIEAERLGIPAVAIITDRFIRSAEVMGELNGLPGYPFAVIAHPVANNDDAALRLKAQAAVKAIVPLLRDRKE